MLTESVNPCAFDGEHVVCMNRKQSIFLLPMSFGQLYFACPILTVHNSFAWVLFNYHPSSAEIFQSVLFILFSIIHFNFNCLFHFSLSLSFFSLKLLTFAGLLLVDDWDACHSFLFSLDFERIIIIMMSMQEWNNTFYSEEEEGEKKKHICRILFHGEFFYHNEEAQLELLNSIIGYTWWESVSSFSICN